MTLTYGVAAMGPIASLEYPAMRQLRRWQTVGALAVGAALVYSYRIPSMADSEGRRIAGAAAETAASAGANPPARRTQERPAHVRVVAFGHADVDGGLVPLSPLVAGQIEELPVAEGERVVAGQLLLRLKSDQARLDVARAEAALRVSRTKLMAALRVPSVHALMVRQQEQGVAAAFARLEGQRRQVDRLEKLNETSAVTNETLQAARERVRELEAAHTAEQLRLDILKLEQPAEAIEMARADFAAAEAALAKAKDAVAGHSLAAPEAGTILRLTAARGQLVSPTAGMPVAWLCPERPRVVRCEVDQEFASLVTTGMTAEAISDGAAGQTWKGTVLRCSEWIATKRSLVDEPLVRNDVRTMECTVSLAPSGPMPRIGQRLRVLLFSAETDLAGRLNGGKTR